MPDTPRERADGSAHEHQLQTGRVRALAVDADLGRYLTAEEFAAAEPSAIGTVGRLPSGPWEASLDGHSGMSVLLVLDGLLLRRVSVGRAMTVELLGVSDALLSVPRVAPAGFIDASITWEVLEPARVMWLSASFAGAARRWPGLWMAVCERVETRAHRSSVARALSGLTRADDRIEVLLWVLSERWGRVTPDGVLVQARLKHRVLAELVSARRPTVTTAISLLERRGALVRRGDGGWLLTGDPPTLGDAGPTAGHDRLPLFQAGG